VTSAKETFIPRVTKEKMCCFSPCFSLSQSFTIKWQKLLPSTDMYEIEATKFLDVVIAAKKAGLTEISAKVQELRMAECKPLKRTDAVTFEFEI